MTPTMQESAEVVLLDATFLWILGKCHVQVKERTNLQGEGKSPKEAIGDLLVRNQGFFGIRIPEEVL